MSKKKPYSKIENARLLRTSEFERKRTLRKCAKEDAPNWFVLLVNYTLDMFQEMVSLIDFLWVVQVKGRPPRLTSEASALPSSHRELLVRQCKATKALYAVLEKRMNLGWYPASAGDKEAKRSRGKSGK